MTMHSKPTIFVVISFLAVALIYSSSLTFDVSAKRVRVEGSLECGFTSDAGDSICCWMENDIGPVGEVFTTYEICCITESPFTADPYCIELEVGHQTGGTDSVFPGGGVAEDPTPTPPLRTPGQGSLPQDGVLEQPPTPPLAPRTTAPLGEITPEAEQPPAPPPPSPRTPGQSVSPGVLEQPSTDEGVAGTSPRTSQGAAPPLTGEGGLLDRLCGVGSVWDPNIMICVPDLPPVELCPDGSIRQPNGECPALPPTIPTEEERAPLEEAEQPQTEEPEEPEQESDVQEDQDNEGN